MAGCCDDRAQAKARQLLAGHPPHKTEEKEGKKKSWTVFCPQRGRHSRRRRRNNNPLPAYCLGWLGNRLLINIALASPLPSLSMYVVRSLALLASASSHSCALSLSLARAHVLSHTSLPSLFNAGSRQGDVILVCFRDKRSIICLAALQKACTLEIMSSSFLPGERLAVPSGLRSQVPLGHPTLSPLLPIVITKKIVAVPCQTVGVFFSLTLEVAVRSCCWRHNEASYVFPSKPSQTSFTDRAPKLSQPFS